MNFKRLFVTAAMVIAADMILERVMPDDDPNDDRLINGSDVALGVTAAVLIENFGKKLAR